jgi:hypothetical protein
LRSQVDYLFTFKQPKNAVENIYESYAPENIDSWQELKKKLLESIRDRGCMVIDNMNNGSIHRIRAPAVEIKYTLFTSKNKKKAIINKKVKK